MTSPGPLTILAPLLGVGSPVRGLVGARPQSSLLLASGPFTPWAQTMIVVGLVDLVCIPLSLLLVLLARVTRGEGWTWVLRVLAVINLALALVLLTEFHRETLVLPVLALQGLGAIALLVVLAEPSSRARFLGPRTPNPPSRGP